jgi:preprotein translocase subunit SecF
MKEQKEEENLMNESITSRFSETVALLLVTIVMVFFFVKFIFY